MSKENITTVIVTLGSVIAAIIALLWPAQAGTYGELIKVVVAALLAIVAILYPSGKAVAQVYKSRATAAYYAAVSKGAIKAPSGEPTEDVTPQIDAVIQGIKNDLASDGIPYKDLQGEDDPVPMAPRVVQKLANYWNDASVSLAFKMVLLAKAIAIAGKSFEKATALPAPTTWVEVAQPQTYWAAHQVTCAIHSEGLFHQVLMPIRQALKIRDTGSV
jgi:hypothetical protein